MGTRTTLKAALLASIVAQPAIAANFDGKQPMICAPIAIVACGPDAECGKKTAASVNFPQFLTVDVVQNEITGTRPSGETLKTSIDSVRHSEDDMMLQGVEGRAVWSVKIAENTGDMTMTAARDNDGFVAFGACTLR